jgi:hypothetical protein
MSRAEYPDGPIFAFANGLILLDVCAVRACADRCGLMIELDEIVLATKAPDVDWDGLFESMADVKISLQQAISGRSLCTTGCVKRVTHSWAVGGSSKRTILLECESARFQ